MADNTSTPDQGCRLTFHGVECLAQLEPLWLSLFDWHEEIGAAGLPVIERSASWPLRRALYADFFAHPDTFVVLATLAGAGAGAGAGVVVGYCLAHLQDGADDTWPTSDRIGHIESLAVLPSERGAGIGTALLDAAEQRLAELGATTVAIEVMVGNDSAQQFYQSRAMLPVTVRLMRLGAREVQG